MEVIKTEFPGLLIIKPQIFRDQRGHFAESYNAKRYQQHGITGSFMQDNLSVSKKGVLRGLHFQQPHAQGKLISVLDGEVFDVAVDLRQGSPTFARAFCLRLKSENPLQLWIPPGFAHGFQVLSERALCLYKCDEYYHKESELSLIWNDPALDIDWPNLNPELSDKDQSARRLCDFNKAELPIFEGLV